MSTATPQTACANRWLGSLARGSIGRLETDSFMGTVAKGLVGGCPAAAQRNRRFGIFADERFSVHVHERERSFNQQRAVVTNTNVNVCHKSDSSGLQVDLNSPASRPDGGDSSLLKAARGVSGTGRPLPAGGMAASRRDPCSDSTGRDHGWRGACWVEPPLFESTGRSKNKTRWGIAD